MANGNSHDQNFKNLILDFPRESLAFFAPAEAPAADDDVRITPVRQEQLKDRLGDRFRELDIPLLIEWTDQRREALLFVIEEETDRGRFSVHRLAHYCLDLAELMKTDRVVPVVIFLRSAAGVDHQLNLGSEHHDYLCFDYIACDISSLFIDDWEHSENIVARLNLPNMRHDDMVRAHAGAVRGLRALEPDVEKQAKYMDFIDIYAPLTDNDLRRYGQEYPEEVAIMATFSERHRQAGREQGQREGREQGREQGREEGRAQGFTEGERRVLVRQLELRFGPLPLQLRQRLDDASQEDVERWSERILAADSLDEVFE